MVIHELFTPEDTNYLVDWARPRLSRRRDIVNAEDKTFRKAEELNRQTVSNASRIKMFAVGPIENISFLFV